MEVYSEPENITCGKVKLEAPPQQLEEPLENHSNSSSNKQNSIFTLTLDEFQYKSGKSFGSMNMDEFLTSVWNAEGNQASPISNQNGPPNDHDHNVAIETSTLVQQCSLSIPTSLCNKTVEEVWSEINKNEMHDQQNPSTISSHELPQRLQTFGEMTLEDFLVKAGVIQEASSFTSQQRLLEPFQNQIANNYPSINACLDVNVGTAQVMGFELSNHSNTGNNLLDNGASIYHMFTQNGRFVGESSNNTGNGKCINASDPTEPSSRRRTSGTLEVAVERRQRRMIKNRESAARSRARKQAYTAELEIELNQLREENARLKLILAEAEIKRRHEMIKGKQWTKAHRVTEKLRTIRRSSSLAW